MNPIILGGILRNFYDSFDITEFNTRLKVQKIVYLMKSKDMSLGYDFILYLYGPYSVELTRDAFQIGDLVNDFPSMSKIIPSERKEGFAKFILELEKNARKDDIVWLEVVASYLFLKKLGFDNDGVLAKMKEKRPDFDISDEKIKEIISEINSEEFFV